MSCMRDKTTQFGIPRGACCSSTSKVKIKESTTLLYLDFLLRFGQVWTCPNRFFIFTPTLNPELDIGSGPYRHPNLWLDLGPIHPGSGLNLSLGPDYGSTISEISIIWTVAIWSRNMWAGLEMQKGQLGWILAKCQKLHQDGFEQQI